MSYLYNIGPRGVNVSGQTVTLNPNYKIRGTGVTAKNLGPSVVYLENVSVENDAVPFQHTVGSSYYLVPGESIQIAPDNDHEMMAYGTASESTEAKVVLWVTDVHQ